MIRNKKIQKNLAEMIKNVKQQQRTMQLTLKMLEQEIENDVEDEYLSDNEEMLCQLDLAIDSLSDTLEYLIETAKNNWE